MVKFVSIIIIVVLLCIIVTGILWSKESLRYVIRMPDVWSRMFLTLISVGMVGFICVSIYAVMAERQIVINEVCSDNFSVSLGTDICDYIELYNPTLVSVSLEGYAISDDEEDKEQYVFGDIAISPQSYLLIKLNGDYESADIDNLQAPFRLNDQGESVVLYDDSGELLDKVEVPGLDYDTAYARTEDGSAEWTRSACTPMAGNRILTKNPDITFSAQSGFYDEPFYLELFSAAGDTIYYTVDGSTPNENSDLYTEPLYVHDISYRDDIYSDNADMSAYNESVFEAKSDKAFLVRAISVDAQGQCSEVVNATYFVGFDQKDGYDNISVISLVTEPEDLFGDEEGIYVVGAAYKDGVEGALTNYSNKGKEWEREVELTYFDAEHTCLFEQNCGLRIQGASKRAASQKSLTINTRYKYGSPYLEQNIFGNDTQISKISMKGTLRYVPRATFPYELVKERDVTVPDSLYTVIFINGEYWGLYEIEERYTAQYFEQHYGIDRDNVALLKQATLEEGTMQDQDDYHEMLSFASSNDMSDSENYAKICTMMDVQSFIEFICTQTYICNMDYASTHNVYTWRSKTVGDHKYEDRRWRWLLYDVDYSAGMDEYTNYDVDAWRGDMPYAEFTAADDALLRALLVNDTFKEDLVITFMDMCNTCFDKENVLPLIDEYIALLEEPMKASMERFEYEGFFESVKSLDTMRTFYENRYPYAVTYLAWYLGLSSVKPLQIQNDLSEGGVVHLNTLTLNFEDASTWTGDYFMDYPVHLEAVPNEGYRFVGWTGDVVIDDGAIDVYIPEIGMNITANFEQIED